MNIPKACHNTSSQAKGTKSTSFLTQERSGLSTLGLRRCFFRCPKYVNECITMFRETYSFHPLNLNKLLTGDSNLTIENNAKIFEAVLKYIKSTKRFSNT